MEQKQIEELYRVLDQASQLLSEDLDISYLEGLIEICEDLVQNKIQIENEKPSDNIVKRLEVLLRGLHIEKYDSESIRKGISLAYLRAIQVDKIQPTHHQTPDIVAIIVAYIIGSFVKDNDKIDILDPFVGVGNLLATVINYLKLKTVSLGQVTGIEIDDALLALSGISFDLQNLSVNLIEDNMLNIDLPKVDVVTADVPLLHKVNSQLTDNQLIYKANQALKPNGLAVYVIPSLLIEGSGATEFLTNLTKDVYVQGIIKFDDAMFKNKEAAKNLLIIQKHGQNVTQAKEVLLAQVPSLKETTNLSKFFEDVDKWIESL